MRSWGDDDHVRDHQISSGRGRDPVALVQHRGRSAETGSAAASSRNGRAQWNNWIKDLRTELYQIVYDQPIYPKNLYLDRAPMKHAEYREKVNQRQIDLMHERDIWVKPGR